MVKKVVFLGLLSNVDSSILKLKLDHGFNIKEVDKTKLENFINKIKYSNGSYLNFSDKTLWKIQTKRSDNSYYIITNSVLVNDDDEVRDWFEDYVYIYLRNFLRKVRLYTGSSIHIHHFYHYYDSTLELSLQWLTSFAKDSLILNLTDNDIKNFYSFNSVKLPFLDENLQLAYKHYEQSFRVSDWKLSFLILMIGIEILVSPADKGELVNRISRNMAVLLGENSEEAEEIFKDMKDLYAHRSKIVHRGKERFSDKDFLKLREFLGNAILEFNQIYEHEEDIFGEKRKIKSEKLDKISNRHDKLLYMLNFTGFGERPWKL